jgi:hypothetical protein
VDFIVKLSFGHNLHPVLFLEVKDDAFVDTPKKRFTAAEQIRARFETMLGDCPLPRLYGISVLGTSLRVYVANTATREITPAFSDWPNSVRNVPPNFLQGGWDTDILSPEGFGRMKDIVKDIKDNALTLKRIASGLRASPRVVR